MRTYKTETAHLAPSLVALFNEIDAKWPKRSEVSDGWIGDAAHQARTSDHNPDRNVGGVVRAIDVTAQGIDVDALLAAVVKDPRVWYVIWNRRIASVTHGWKWQPYNGPNPHTHHVHISIKHTRTAETNTARWFKVPPAAPKPAPKPSAGGHALGGRTLSKGARGDDVAFVQRWLGITADGVFGPKTDAAVRRYQRMRGLEVDGIVGPKTWAPMLKDGA